MGDHARDVARKLEVLVAERRRPDAQRVENLDRLVAQLKAEGVTVVDEIQTVDYGKFVHIMDPEGNKIELWEPNDAAYDKMVGGRTK